MLFGAWHHPVRLFCASVALGAVLGVGLGALRGASRPVLSSDGPPLSVVQARLVALGRPGSALYLLRLLNAGRARAGRAALRLDPRLDAIAQARSRDMIARRYFSHHIPGLPGLPGVHMIFDILDRDRVPYDLAGENIATNDYVLFMAPAAVLDRVERDFAASQDHRSNMLDPVYTRVGIGLAGDARTGRVIVSEVFAGP